MGDGSGQRRPSETPCRYRHHALWTDWETAKYVAEDMTNNDEGSWTAIRCPGDPNAQLKQHGPHWHVVLNEQAAATIPEQSYQHMFGDPKRRRAFDAVDRRDEENAQRKILLMSDDDLHHLAGSAALLDAEVQNELARRKRAENGPSDGTS